MINSILCLILIFFQITVSESVGTVCVPVYRTGGLFSTVGAGYSFHDITATGNGIDYDTNPATVTLGPQETEGCLSVNITNDLTPEVDEVII